uniref:Uncharacterized protein n=1 Tax=Vespula pensylvanica TaxID=30213 RepID=A0A834P5F0_VESPE|nr:hypothetical protein H0235_005792 [Vespula pensylvanica]
MSAMRDKNCGEASLLNVNNWTEKKTETTKTTETTTTTTDVGSFAVDHGLPSQAPVILEDLTFMEYLEISVSLTSNGQQSADCSRSGPMKASRGRFEDAVTTFVKSRIGIGRYPETDRDSWWKEGRTGRGGGTETKRIHPLSSVGKAAAVDLAAPLM